ncbi:MAG TPA: hypothetical protein H9980_09465 [Candidatus Erysipelatoclostridium merdavium]|uniref:HTH cro/C1-type domain-containing protein n=1 Tax=Candidatus Erysipelatoclostridium merdavium TaxID=2838566 RepID=A0A9D2BMH9_9FIRM|nr:hypothetical protein [Candidatus Erysipelatoclostridium merdavium]
MVLCFYLSESLESRDIFLNSDIGIQRDLSFPDVSSIPKLAEIFEVSVDDLMQVKTKTKETPPDNKINEIIPLALNGVALAMGIAVVVLLFLNEIEINLAIRMLAIGLVCLAIMQLIKKE